jgi:large subunit ribosomal protein L6
MSRIGKKTVTVPAGVTVEFEGKTVSIKGPKGQLSWTMPEGIVIEREGDSLQVTRISEERFVRAMHGTARALVANMVEGVSEGFRKNLEIQGVGFRATKKGDLLDLSVGYSHPVEHPIPSDLEVTVTDNTKILVEGIDKQKVGQFAAEVRSYYPPEPYKGKGIRYAGEVVRRKAGKSGK